MKKLVLFLLILAFCIPQVACNTLGFKGDDNLHSVKSLSDIKKVISDFGKGNANYYGGGGVVDDAMESEAPTANDSSKGGGEDRYSSTNSQVDGVDEGDIVKVDGESIYKLSQNGFVIVDVDKGKMEDVCRIERDNYVPQELYVSGDKLIMIGGVYETFAYSGNMEVKPEMDCCMYISYSKTEISIYDISDRSNPQLERSLIYDGNFLTARLIENKLYFMLNYWFYSNDESGYIPSITDGNSTADMAFSDIFYFNNIPSYSYLIVGMIDVDDPEISNQKAYLGVFGEFYVNTENIFVATVDYSKCYSRFSYDERKTRTRILKFELEDLNFKAMAFVEGKIKDRYSMDEYDSNFRIATTTMWWNYSGSRSYSTVFVLNSNLQLQGKVSGIGENEDIYSVRFDKNECSITTFKRTDPLYLVDLSNPKKPTVTGELKEDGVNLYMHPVKDNYLIGFGMDTEDLGNNGVVWKGIKLELYEKVNGKWEPRDIVKIGTAYSYSEALYNPKAILAEFEQGYNMFGFACEIWDYSNYQSTLTTQGYYIFSIDFDNLKFEYTALSNFSGSLNYSYGNDDWYDWYDQQYSYIRRGVAIGDYIYTISDQYITSYALDGMTKVNQLKIADFTPARELFK